MQTNFSAEQLADRDTAVTDTILRSCVHCGLCTATCPTFVILGDEDDSPRGRIYLIKDMLETDAPATEPLVRHLDRCLSCLACMTTCPSGVDYMHLIDHARKRVAQTSKRLWPDALLRRALTAILPYPARLRLALRGAALARATTRVLPKTGRTWLRLRAMLALAPLNLPPQRPFRKKRMFAAQGTRRARVALLAGCAQQVLDPEIHAATIRLLNRLGIEVIVVKNTGCCGALTHHMGEYKTTLQLARRNVIAWTIADAEIGFDAIITNTSGCGTFLKDYEFLFRDTPHAQAAARISGKTRDITEFLEKFHYQPTQAAPNLTIAYHSACSLQHGQKITDTPRKLLQRAGFTVTEPRDQHLCCGSAGTYNILQPEIANDLRNRKLDTLRALHPDAIAAGNIGCLIQLSNAGIPTVHTVQLLDWMAGGPQPNSLQKK